MASAASTAGWGTGDASEDVAGKAPAAKALDAAARKIATMKDTATRANRPKFSIMMVSLAMGNDPRLGKVCDRVAQQARDIL
jgi:hypothetical protein